jgi:hypothetical protein
LRLAFARAGHAAPLLRFLAPSARPTWRVHFTRACLTRYVPSSGFLTLLTVSSSPGSPALFHAGALLEFHTLQSFIPRPEPPRLSARFLPSCRSRLPRPRLPRLEGLGRHGVTKLLRPDVRSSGRPVMVRSASFGSRPTSGPCSPVRVRCVVAGCYPDAAPVALLGFGPSSGSSPPPRFESPEDASASSLELRRPRATPE